MYFIKYYRNVNPVVTFQESRMIVQVVFTRKYPRKWDVLSGIVEMVWDVLSRVAIKAWGVLSRVTKTDEMFCPEWQNFVECFARGVKKGYGCFVPA